MAREEVRVYPLMDTAYVRHPAIDDLRRRLGADGIDSEVRRVGYEFQRGATEVLVVARVSIPGVAACRRGDHPERRSSDEVHAVDPPGRLADPPRPRGVGRRCPRDEQKAVYADYQAINQTPGVTPGMALQPPRRPRPCGSRTAQTLVTDGPFVDTKEALGG